jgi:hypothetical protein
MISISAIAFLLSTVKIIDLEGSGQEQCRLKMSYRAAAVKRRVLLSEDPQFRFVLKKIEAG